MRGGWPLAATLTLPNLRLEGGDATLPGGMQIYRAEVGQALIREGEIDDYMLLIIEGEVEIVKRDRRDMAQPMTRVGPGATLGEMSMIDGEPRFATCVAAAPTLVGVLVKAVEKATGRTVVGLPIILKSTSVSGAKGVGARAEKKVYERMPEYGYGLVGAFAILCCLGCTAGAAYIIRRRARNKAVITTV
jgi:hypothetical protein